METEQTLLAAMCRRYEAACKGGYDGKEHPEHEAEMRYVAEGFYPVTLQMIADRINAIRAHG